MREAFFYLAMPDFVRPFVSLMCIFGMRPRACDPLLLVAGAATLVALVYIVLVCIEASPPSLSWTDKDFANYWAASRLALEGRGLEAFGPQDTYLAYLRTIYGPDYPWRAWSYPPHYLLLMLPLGLISYKSALILFLLATFLFLCAAIRVTSRQVTGRQLLLLLPAVATNGFCVQNGFLISALLLAGLALRDKKPILAGICFGLLTVKPQLGILLPFLFLWERQWQTIASACVTTLALVAISSLAFGNDAWSGYFRDVVPHQTHVMKELEGLFPHMMPTVFGSVRSLGFDSGAAFTAHVPFALVILALYFVSLYRLDTTEARAASTLFATTLAMPYLVNYDLTALVAGAALLNGARNTSALWRSTTIALASVPVLTPLLSLYGWPIAPIVIFASWLTFLYDNGALFRFTPSPSPATP